MQIFICKNTEILYLSMIVFGVSKPFLNYPKKNVVTVPTGPLLPPCPPAPLPLTKQQCLSLSERRNNFHEQKHESHRKIVAGEQNQYSDA